jgi:hypothetical protein
VITASQALNAIFLKIRQSAAAQGLEPCLTQAYRQKVLIFSNNSQIAVPVNPG